MSQQNQLQPIYICKKYKILVEVTNMGNSYWQRTVTYVNNLFSASKKPETRTWTTTVTDTGRWLESFGRSSEGASISEETALSLSAVYACVRVIAEAVASLPWHVYESTDIGKQIAAKHPLNKLLRSEPNPLYTSFVFRETLITHVLLWGNAYAKIVRVNGIPTRFDILNPINVTPTLKDGALIYKTPQGNIAPNDIIHIPGLGFDGITGKSPIRLAAENIGVGLNSQRFGSKFFENGAHLGGVLEHPGVLKADAHTRLRDSWDNKYKGVNNSNKVAILEEGMKYTRIGIPPEEAQFIETRKFSITEVARIYKVPPHMIQDLERATFSNIEHQDLGFVKHTMVPWCVRIEQEFNRKVFSEPEKEKYFNKFNLNGMLRGDSAARATFYKDMFNIGVFSHNDILELEDMNKVKDGDQRFVPLNMIPVDKVGQVIQQPKNQ